MKLQVNLCVGYVETYLGKCTTVDGRGWCICWQSSLRAAQSLQGQLVSEQQLMDAIPAVHNVKGKKERQRDKGMNRERERESKHRLLFTSLWFLSVHQICTCRSRRAEIQPRQCWTTVTGFQCHCVCVFVCVFISVGLAHVVLQRSKRPFSWIWNIKSPPFRYSITKNRCSCKKKKKDNFLQYQRF